MDVKPNDRQVGGDHYKGAEYQHWDFVTDLSLPYLMGVATKYVARWRKKNGTEDLKKAIHYIDKCQERKIAFRGLILADKFWKFVTANDLTTREASAIWLTLAGNWDAAREAIYILINNAEDSM